MQVLQKLKNWFKNKYLFVDDVIPVSKAASHQVDERTVATIKRVRKAFDAQQKQMDARAMKAHDISCSDIETCKKKKCFKWEPDKIVSEPKEMKRGD